MPSINWKIRFHRKNILFLIQTATSVILPVFTYFGLHVSDITSWDMLFDTCIRALRNPYVLLLILSSLFHAVTDPTTFGVGDSTKALTYSAPKKSNTPQHADGE